MQKQHHRQKHYKKNFPNRFSGKEQPIVPSYKFRTEKEKKKKTLSKILSDFRDIYIIDICNASPK